MDCNLFVYCRQLSTLSRHAEEMFGNLFQEAEGEFENIYKLSLRKYLDRSGNARL